MALGLGDFLEGFKEGLLGRPRDPNPNKKEQPKTQDFAPISDITKDRARSVINKISGYKNIIGMPPITMILTRILQQHCEALQIPEEMH